MKRLVLLALVVTAAAAACTLNPQPFPPDNPDGSVASTDAGKGNDATFGNDAAGNVPDAAQDASPGPESDGGAGDASVDASVDAADAEVDATDANVIFPTDGGDGA